MQAFEKAKILMVDDKPGNLLALEVVFERTGYTIILAHSGKEALSCLMKEDFSLILMDVQMPEMDGFEVAALLRSQSKNRYSPIIFLTAAMKTDASMVRGYRAGAVDYLLKPLVPEILRGKVKALIELYQNSAEIKQLNRELKSAVRDREGQIKSRTEALQECGKNLRQTNFELAAYRDAGLT